MPTHIIAITGSLRAHSRTELVAHTALRGAIYPEVTTEVLNLHTLQLPLFDNRADVDTYPAAVWHFLEQIRHAAGFLFVAPVYHGTVSGAFKNALDFLHLAEPDAYQGKVVGLISVAGGAMSVNTINTLDYIARALHLWRVPTTVAVPGAAITPEGTLGDPDIERRLSTLGAEVCRATQVLLDTPVIEYH
ncbi:MAG: NADPH-dependent FMN reductase [Chloroflexota bacterium]